jgi:hypothetical protein
MDHSCPGSRKIDQLIELLAYAVEPWLPVRQLPCRDVQWKLLVGECGDCFSAEMPT